MLNRKYVKSFFMLLIFVLLITGCASNVGQEEQPDLQEPEENAEPASGGTLKLSVTSFNTLNPLYNNNAALFQLHHLVYESLVTFDQKMDIQPLLAESWEISEDSQSIDFVLKKGITWHDGIPFSAEDVIFTVNLIKGNMKEIQNPSIFKTSLQQISDIREIEAGVIRVTFSRAIGNGLEVMTFPILPKHLFTNNLTNIEEFPMIGTGPYQLKEYESMRKIVLEKNNQYWKKKPFIDEIEVMVVPDAEAQLSLFENGELDLAQPIAIDWAKYVDDKNVNVYEYVSNHYELLGFNFKNKMMQDINLRKAIAYSIDRHELVKNIYLNHGTVTDAPINPSSWLFDEDSIQYGYDISEANKILEESGYTMNSSSQIRTDENNISLKFRLITNKDNIIREKTAYFIQNELSKAGIEIEVQLLEWEEFQQRVNKGNFDLILAGWELSIIPDLSFAFHSSQIGKTNFISFQDEAMDELLESIFTIGNRMEKQNQYKNLQNYIAQEVPYVSLLFKNGSILRLMKNPHLLRCF
jgi:peptide/nickel transport system substrate-binding protein